MIACDQGIDEVTLNGMFADGNQVTFPNFVEIIDSLENDKDTDEQCVISFSTIADGMWLYEKDLRDAGFDDNQVQWLLEHMDEVDENGNVIRPGKVDEANDMFDSVKTGDNFTVESFDNFVKKVSVQHQKQAVDGEKRYDFLTFIKKFYQ